MGFFGGCEISRNIVQRGPFESGLVEEVLSAIYFTLGEFCAIYHTWKGLFFCVENLVVYS